MVALSFCLAPRASSSTSPNLHSHRASSASDPSSGSLRAWSLSLSLYSSSDRTSYSEAFGRGTAKSSRFGGKKSMTRTVARELMFWNGRVYGAPFGGIFVCFSSEMMDDTGRGAMRWCEQRTGWPVHQRKSSSSSMLAYRCCSTLAFGSVEDGRLSASF